jgi:carboxyl-terminal processing protease
LSLNLQKRKEERERLERERLTRENARRAAQNLPALKNAEELAEAKFPDTVLDQSAEIMTDMVTGLRPLTPAPSRTVRSEVKKPG